MKEEIIDEENKEITESTNVFEEVQVYQEVEKTKKEIRTDSYFDGSLIELIGWRLLATLITIITLGFAAPWAQCMLYSYQIKHTVYNGKRLRFEGTGGDLFVNIFKWVVFSIFTLGIYTLFIPVKKTRWVISNIHFENEPFTENESFFDGKTIQLIGVNILCNLLNIISLGLLCPFTVCYKLGWINKHTIINRKRIAFDGRAISLFGKYILWSFLTLITFGIYGLWLPIKMLKWQTNHTHIKVVGEVEPKDNSLWIAVPVLVIGIVIIVSLIIPFAIKTINNGININNYNNDNSGSNSRMESQMVESVMSY